MQENSNDLWTNKQKTLHRWLALPKKERKPKTIELLALEIDVDPATLYRWRRLDGFMDEVRKLIREQLDDDLSEIYSALRRESRKGSFQHIKLSLELAGDYVERSEVKIDDQLDDSARAARIATILNGARERRDRQSTESGSDDMATVAGATK